MKCKIGFLLVVFLMIFTVGFAQSTNDYRTFASGNWNSVNTWERYNGSAWINPAPSTPTSSVGSITVQNGHTVTVTANVSIDQTTVNAGGTIVVNIGILMTVVGGAGDDITVYGTVTVNGSLTIDAAAAASQAVIGSGGTISVSQGGTMTVGRTANRFSTVTISDGGTFYVNGTYATLGAGASGNQTNTYISGGGTLEFGSTGVATGFGNMNISSGAIMVILSATGVNGNFGTTQFIGASAGTFVFSGEATGMVTGTNLPATVANLTFDNPNGVTLTQNTVVTGTTSILSGNVIFNGYDLTVNSFTSPAYYYYDMPNNTITVSNFSVSTDTPTLYPGKINRNWAITGTYTGSVTARFYWDAADDNYYNWGAMGTIPSVYVGTTEYTQTNYSISGSPRWVEVSIPNQLTKATYTIGVAGDQTLPIELSSFTAVPYQALSILLKWVTQTETNVSGFRVYRSSDDFLEHAVMLDVFISATNTSQTQYYAFYDHEIYEPGSYYYWLENVDYDGSSGFHGPVNVVLELPVTVPTVEVWPGINKIYPNPFNPSTTISYGVKNNKLVKIEIFNAKGQKIRELFNGLKQAGNYKAIWDGLSDDHTPAPTGMYVIRLKTDGKSYMRKILLLK